MTEQGSEQHPATDPGDGRFNLLNFTVRVTAPISWPDEKSGVIGDSVRAIFRGELKILREEIREAQPALEVEFEL